MKIHLLQSALDDLTDGFYFYESNGEGLGSYFLETLFSDIDSLKLYAGTHQEVFGHYRLLSKRFPYAVYYKVSAEKIYINAVLDCRSNPEWIRKKLDDNDDSNATN